MRILVLRRRSLVRLMVVGVALWLCSVLYWSTRVRDTIDSVWTNLLKENLDRGHLADLMAYDGNTNYQVNPLANIFLPKEGILNFFHLPKRKVAFTFTEITTAHRDTSYPLAPDFTFHIQYYEDHVVLYEDFGPGCVFRIFLFPNLPTDMTRLDSITAQSLRDSFLLIKVDGKNFWFSLEQLMEGKNWPFLVPINTMHPKAASGMGSYVPFCYQVSMEISYYPKQRLPANLFDLTVNCSHNDFTCPVHVYAGISRHKYPAGAKVSSFSQDPEDHRKIVSDAIPLLMRPELHGPDNAEPCVLQCLEVCPECKRHMWISNKAGVVTAIKVRVFETATSKPMPNWNKILLTITFDSSMIPQVDKVPLGSLFGATASLNDFRGSVLGRRSKFCRYEDSTLDLPAMSTTGYCYFPMPFWRNARIVVDGATSIETSTLLCFQVSSVDNMYEEATTAYFNVQKSYYTEHSDGWRNILTLNHAWGHITGLFIETDNLQPKRYGGATRWPALQSDPVLYVDGRLEASMLGTGLEDFFSYSHGFVYAENTTYSFNGVFHGSPHESEQLTWHCYRYNVLDPIPFHSSVRFVMEGVDRSSFFSPLQPISYEEHFRKRESGQSMFSFVVLFYARETSGMTQVDTLHMGDPVSEEGHQFKMATKFDSGRPFLVRSCSFLGQVLSNTTYNRQGRMFHQGNKFSFQLKIMQPNSGVILRREFHSLPKFWNQKARVWVNGEDQGVWFSPMGVLNDHYSLRQDDLLLGANLTSYSYHGNVLTVDVEPLSDWRDISYTTLVIH